MQAFIRRWLGITEIDEDIHELVNEIVNEIVNLRRDIRLRADSEAGLFNGVARLIAKLDPIYGQSEFNPARIDASKELEKQIISKLIAEAKIQQHNP